VTHLLLMSDARSIVAALHVYNAYLGLHSALTIAIVPIDINLKQQ
jgi:hypothetical protein